MSQEKPRRGFGCLSFFLLLLLAGSAVLNLILFAALGMGTNSDSIQVSTKAPRFNERLFIEGKTSKKQPEDQTKDNSRIALIDLRGLIGNEVRGQLGDSMVEDMELAMRQASSDPKIKAILLQIESPGGEVTASDRVYHAVKKAREKKPVVVFLGSIAASGGFYVACAGSYLIANETTFTGSIGVIISTINFESFLGKVGIAPVVFKSGRFKDILSGARPITDEERELIQGIVTQSYEKFLGIVADERKLDREMLRGQVADGRILTGKDALAAGLVDALGQFEDALAKARELGGAPNAPLHRFRASYRFADFLSALSQSAFQERVMRIEMGNSTKIRLEPGRLYYLPAALGGM